MILTMLRAKKRLAKAAVGGAFAAGALAGGAAAAVAVTGVALTGAVGIAGLCTLKRVKDKRAASATTEVATS